MYTSGFDLLVATTELSRRLGKAMEEGEVIFPVRLRDMAEAERHKRASAGLIHKLRDSG